MIPEQLIPVKINDLKPFVRFAREQVVGNDFRYNNIIAYDSRAAYITEGEGILKINSKEYPIKAGTLIVWPPGQLYGFYKKSEVIRMVLLNFDCVNDHSEYGLLHPEKIEKFDASRLQSMPYLSECSDENGVLLLQNALFAENLMRELVEEYTRHMVFSDQISSGIMMQILSYLTRSLFICTGERKSHADEIIAWLNVHMQEKITYDELAKVFNYHPGHINRLINRSTGMSLHQYLMRIRLERAYILLDSGNSVAETAEMCGFSDAVSFSKAFHRKMGIPPSAVFKAVKG